MRTHKIQYDLSSSDYIRNTEQILKSLTRAGHRLVEATLHGKPVYIVTDMALAKQIFEDAKNFSFTPNSLADDASLTDGTQAFVNEGLESSLLSSSYEDYKETRKLFNQAFRKSYLDRAELIDARAKRHIVELLDKTQPPVIDALVLCREYWMPLVADVIGVSALSFPELEQLARCSRTLVEANGLIGDPGAIAALMAANREVVALIRKVVDAGAAPRDSALGYFLSEVAPEIAVDFARTFAIGGIDTGSSALALQTHLLAADTQQRARFLAMSQSEQQNAMTEIASKEAPTLYTPRFAVRDVRVMEFDIPKGSFVQLAVYALNHCANPDFDIDRASANRCPLHNNETLPFGHARHKCPGETLARHLIPVFLNGLFSHYSEVGIQSCVRDMNVFSRSIGELTLKVQQRKTEEERSDSVPV